jgi:hydroxymethylbilane synthase
MERLRIGTRGSALARAQAALVKALLAERNPSLAVEIEILRVSGDQEDASGVGQVATQVPTDKSRWVDTIEDALLAERIDLAVHSAKDVPGALAEGLSLLGAPPRAAVEDVLCRGAHSLPQPRETGARGAGELEDLDSGARVGTSSVRRAAQLRAAREDLEVVTIHGNVDTRLRRLTAGRPPRERAPGDAPAVSGEGGLDAIVLARAGLQRLGREAEIGAVLDPERFVPAPGQGVLALEGRAGDVRAREAVEEIADADAFACLLAERAVSRELSATCNTPLGAYAVPAGCGCLNLRAWVGVPDGSAWIGDELLGGFYDPEALGRRVAERLKAAGAEELLRRAEELAGVEHA